MCVRTSIAFYGNFILDMGRSPGFGSILTDYIRPLKTWFPFGSTPSVLNLASSNNSPDRSTKSTRLNIYSSSTACKHRVSGSLSLPSRGSFHLSFTVLCAIGHQVVFSLTEWSPLIRSGFLVSRSTLDPACSSKTSCTRLSLSPADLPRSFYCLFRYFLQSEPRNARISVWALPRSLAATSGIDVSFSSSGYLDVSVHRVPFHKLWIGLWILEVRSSGFPHSDICGSSDICSLPQLFAAYHVFLRLLVPRHPPYALSCLTFSCNA